jgi:hypothetical protein
MTALTLIATPDPEPFDIHGQPTWIALGIGCLRREYPTAAVTHVDRITDEMALVHGRISDSWFEACLLKDPDFGTGRELYFDSNLGAS